MKVQLKTDDKFISIFGSNYGIIDIHMKRDDRAVFLFVVFVLICASTYAYYSVPSDRIGSIFFVENGKEQKSKYSALRSKTNNKRWPVVLPDKKGSAAVAAKESTKDLQMPKEVIAGWVTITNPWGKEINRFRAGLAGDGWLALPVSACIGGNTWNFKSDSGLEARISGGLWIKGDKVGLWNLVSTPGSFDGPEFGFWNENEPVSWKSIESDNEGHQIKLYPGLTEGFFISTSLPDNINESGVFIQNDRIVGWSFGGTSTKGFMWPSNAVNPLEYRTWVNYFYDITFGNSREEKFAMVLAMQEVHSELTQLAFYIEGFGLQPKLLPEDTPDHLLPAKIIKRMRVIVSNALRRNEGSRVLDMFNSETLKQIGDISLFVDIVPVIAALNGLEAAIIEIEDTGEYITRKLGREVSVLLELHLNYYQDWLRSVVSDGAADEGLRIYTAAKYYYPDDPDIHLRGVELKLLSGDWEGAENLLYMKPYPLAFQTRFQLLARRISDMKGEEGRIVIRFPPGSNRIMVTAAVNGSMSQNFLVDTGATAVTIPSSIADALGLDVVYGQHKLSTAGGPIKAGEVIIGSIEIDGWIEYDVRAYVVDIPGQSGIGLLGLNYLARFQVDLNSEAGTLLLSPR